MIKLVDFIEIADSHLSIMDGSAPMLFIGKEYMNPDLINPNVLEKEVVEVRACRDKLEVWLKEEEDERDD